MGQVSLPRKARAIGEARWQDAQAKEKPQSASETKAENDFIRLFISGRYP